jgi:RNA polymerase sigma factor (sigma-70 family)
MYDDRPLPLPGIDHHRLVRAAARLLGASDAEDVVQDAYVRALEGPQRELNSTQAWLLTVVRHLAIDRLRRRNWMQQWMDTMGATGAVGANESEGTSPSAEAEAALAQEASRALRLLAVHLAPEDGAALLLHDLFEVSHAEIAQASGRSEAASRQQLRRALLRLRQARDQRLSEPRSEPAPSAQTVFHLYLQSLQLRDPQTLWSMLRQPPISAMTRTSATAAQTASAPRAMASGVVQVGGQLGLLLALDGVALCVVPLGVRADCDAEVFS